MTTELLDRSLGSIACSIPGATGVFHELHLDFCCGGKKSLRQAALEKGIDTQILQARLLALSDRDAFETDWRQVHPNRLVEHILSRYHDVHRQQLPELARLAARVEQVHGDHSECPHGLTEFLIELRQELESHMEKEEKILFPMILQGSGSYVGGPDLGGPDLGGPISVMLQEHDQHGQALDRLNELTDHQQPPKNACNTWRALYQLLSELRKDLMQHIHLENNVLFPRALGEEVQNG